MGPFLRMPLTLYNTLTKRLEPFVPLQEGQVRMYVCGMTVYDLCHVGHARSMVAFDVVQRWLKALGYQVTYVRNITDIDDKIIQRAVANGEPIGALTARMIEAMNADAQALGVQAPTHEPRATEHIAGMVRLVQTLQSRELAYPSGSGDMLYAVRQFANYGALSGKSLDELRAGERVAVDQGKRDPLDFVLWKAAKPDEPDDAKWDSPFGPGRPGWHLECSAMSCALLGESFDIHGGGADLQFPHHENEIAQSEGASGQTLARYWMHNGFVRINDEKMSKSLGNFFTIRDVLQTVDAETLRFFIVRAHYRSALNYGVEHLKDARTGLRRLYTALSQVAPEPVVLDWQANAHAQAFARAMNEDFGTPAAVAVLFELAAEVNRSGSAQAAGWLRALGGVLGLLQDDPQAYLQRGASDQALSAEHIQAQIAERAAAKQAKDYTRADAIRHALAEQGVTLKDSPQGTTWERL